jgi:GrpB-like predicted nucleotidyltransferase (UPF0157 family)
MEYLDRLSAFRAEKIGLERDGRVRLVSHEFRWKRLFSDEAHLVYDFLRLEELRLYHCGSTSIPGIAAKPVIDIVGSVPSLAALDEKKAALEALGYEWKGEYGIPGRRYSVLYNQEKTAGYIHLHLFEEGNPEIERHLVFRDYLRAHPEKAAAYEQEKLRLVEAGTPRSEYTEAKAGVLSSLLAEAEAWRKTGSVLAILGSAPGGKNTEAFLREKYPGAEVVHLHREDVRPYQYGEAGEHSDAFPGIVEKMLGADLVVFATPVYWYAMSGPMKDFLDRFSNLLRGKHKAYGEALYGKQMRLLSTGYDDRLPFGFEVPLASTALYLGMDYFGAEYRAVKT